MYVGDTRFDVCMHSDGGSDARHEKTSVYKVMLFVLILLFPSLRLAEGLLSVKTLDRDADPIIVTGEKPARIQRNATRPTLCLCLPEQPMAADPMAV